MLTLTCPHCGEPWDNDELHGSEFVDYRGAFELFREFGCGAFDRIYQDEKPTYCAHSPIYSDAIMSEIADAWAHAEYAEDVDAEVETILEFADDDEHFHPVRVQARGILRQLAGLPPRDGDGAL